MLNASFTPSLLHPTVHLALGYSSVIISLGAVLYCLSVTFEESKPILWVAVVGYSVLQSALWAWKRWVEKGEVFRGKRRRMVKRVSTVITPSIKPGRTECDLDRDGPYTDHFIDLPLATSSTSLHLLSAYPSFLITFLIRIKSIDHGPNHPFTNVLIDGYRSSPRQLVLLLRFECVRRLGRSRTNLPLACHALNHFEQW